MRKLKIDFNGIQTDLDTGEVIELHDWDWVTHDIDAWLRHGKPIKDYFMMYITQGIYPNEWLANCIKEKFPMHFETLQHLLLLI